MSPAGSGVAGSGDSDAVDVGSGVGVCAGATGAMGATIGVATLGAEAPDVAAGSRAHPPTTMAPTAVAGMAILIGSLMG
ncbi:MAG: hypothetical protein QOJ93_2744, partial [Actinomycetota bacterium]|nr:hypothetical protein [Actinomycetota bacterium]